MYCNHHFGRDAAGCCVIDGKPYCHDCLTEVEGKFYYHGNFKDYVLKINDSAKLRVEEANAYALEQMNEVRSELEEAQEALALAKRDFKVNQSAYALEEMNALRAEMVEAVKKARAEGQCPLDQNSAYISDDANMREKQVVAPKVNVAHLPDDAARTASLSNPESAFLYALNVDQAPRDDTRNASLLDPWSALNYALRVDKAPREDTRAAAARNINCLKTYRAFANRFPNPVKSILQERVENSMYLPLALYLFSMAILYCVYGVVTSIH